MATAADPFCPAPSGGSLATTFGAGASRLNVVRKPAVRVRQAVRDNNVALLSRLQHKTDLRNTDKSRLTSLAWAALEVNLEVFEWLLIDYGHDDQELSRDAEHNTIFHLLASVAAPPGLSPMAHVLTSDPNFPPRPQTRSSDELRDTALRMTEIYHTLFPFLLDWSNTGGKTALHFAAQADNAAFIALLCDLGADIDLADLQGNTPLHYASAWGNTASVRALLERGASITARNFEGFTASDFAYSHASRAALDSLARDAAEERKARRRDQRAKEREAREREVYEREQWEREQAERDAWEREQHEREQWERERAYEAASESHASHGGESSDVHHHLTAAARLRSASTSTSVTHASGSSGGRSGSRSGSQSGGHSGAYQSAYTSPPDEPPMPPIPPDIAAAAEAAAAARNAALLGSRPATPLDPRQPQASRASATLGPRSPAPNSRSSTPLNHDPALLQQHLPPRSDSRTNRI
ncbi:Ankyrin repeat domain-containing protein 2A [Vanrija pseudolonga]|uniref:Ankyrin repeat domain-containing protein 2A n=1 Tax=Vanrija pseudolonga TaxID=143232 RepID=A0AAF0YJQ3_9TREE|nr:Ankyrin repeat domain-containing protein 2A [Vanrija pseudolonga]